LLPLTTYITQPRAGSVTKFTFILNQIPRD